MDEVKAPEVEQTPEEQALTTTESPVPMTGFWTNMDSIKSAYKIANML